MTSIRHILTVSVLGLMLVGCAATSTPELETDTPEPVGTRAGQVQQAKTVLEPRQCGTESRTYSGSGNFNIEGRQCVWDAYSQQQPAVFRIIFPTTEGDPIVQDVTVTARDVQVAVDTTKDQFSAEKDRRITTYSCASLSRITGRSGELRLKLERCEGGEVHELVL